LRYCLAEIAPDAPPCALPYGHSGLHSPWTVELEESRRQLDILQHDYLQMLCAVVVNAGGSVVIRESLLDAVKGANLRQIYDGLNKEYKLEIADGG
jgi:hypothetical protein